MQKMDVAGKNVTLERLKGLRDALDGVIRMLEKGNT
jgi:hypothetical protein